MWSHLEPIANYLEPLRSCEIGLLNGHNCPRALVTREVIASLEDGPCGQRTDLGWSIVRVVDHGQCNMMNSDLAIVCFVEKCLRF